MQLRYLSPTLLTMTVLVAGSQQQATQPTPSSGSPVSVIDADLARKLLSAKRVFVDVFGEDALNKSLTAMVLDSVRTSKRFIVTENREKADLILKGIAIQKTSQELHALGSSTSVAGAAGSHRANVSGSSVHGVGSVSGSSSGGFAAQSASIDDSQASTETIEDVRLAVRLVTPDGDVVWSTTQESRGGKYKSPMADVADRVVKELGKEIDKLSRPPANPK